MSDEENDQIWPVAAGPQGQDWADLEEEEEEEVGVNQTKEWERLFDGKVEWADIISDDEPSDDERGDAGRDFGHVTILKRDAGHSHDQRRGINVNSQARALNNKGSGSRQQKVVSPPSSKGKKRNKKAKKGRGGGTPSPSSSFEGGSGNNKRPSKGPAAKGGTSPDHHGNNGGSVWRLVSQRGSSPESKSNPVKALFQDSASSLLPAANAPPFLPFESLLHPAMVEKMRRTGLLRYSAYLGKTLPPLLEGRPFVSLGEDKGEKTVGYVLPILHKLFYPPQNPQTPPESRQQDASQQDPDICSPEQQHDTPQQQQHLDASAKGGVRALLLSPSQEAIERIRSLVETLSKGTSADAGGMVDAPWGERKERRRRDGPVVVSSPAQLLAALANGDASLEDYADLEVVVLEDVDKMLSTPLLQRALDTLKLSVQHQLQQNRTKEVHKVVVSSNSDLSTSVKTFIATTLGGYSSFLCLRTDGTEVNMGEEPQSKAKTASEQKEQQAEDGEKEREKEITHEESTPPAAAVALSFPGQGVYPVPQHLRVSLLVEMLKKGENMESVVVLARLRPSAKRLVYKLRKHGIRALFLGNSGDDLVEEYKGGEFQLLVAVNLTAPELQDKKFSHIINYDVPPNAEAYNQRAERAAHMLTFMIPEESHIMAKIEKEVGSPLERIHLPSMDYNRQKGYNKALKLQQQRLQQQHQFNTQSDRHRGGSKQQHMLGSKQKNQPQKQGPKQYKKKESKQQPQHRTPERAWGGGGTGGGSGGRSRGGGGQPSRHSPASASPHRYPSGGDTWRRGGGSPAGGGGRGGW